MCLSEQVKPEASHNLRRREDLVPLTRLVGPARRCWVSNRPFPAVRRLTEGLRQSQKAGGVPLRRDRLHSRRRVGTLRHLELGRARL